MLALLAATMDQSAAQSPEDGSLARLFGEPVTAAATGQPQLVAVAPAHMEIMTQEDIRRTGATTIPDVLQYVPGVDVRRYGLTGFDVGIRGYNQPYNPRLLVLIDGREVYETAYGHVDWATLPVQLDEIRQIEVIKGPNSALYGFNAVSGVINIITYDPLLAPVNADTLRLGTQDQRSGSVVASAPLGNSGGVRLSAGGLQGTDYAPGSLTPSDAAARINPTIGSFRTEVKLRPTMDTQVFAEAAMTSGAYADKTFTGYYATAGTRTHAFRAGGSLDSGLGLISLSAYHNELIETYANVGVVSFGGSATVDSTVVQANDLIKFSNDHTLRIGLEYRDNTLPSPAFVGGTIGYQDYAASLMWNWRITPTLALTTAVRSDTVALNYSGTPVPLTGLTAAAYSGAGFTEPSYNTGLVWNASDNDTLRLLVARGVQMPSLVDFGLQFPLGEIGPVAIIGNPDIHPTIVQNVELDYDRILPAWHSTLRSAVFAARTDDIAAQPLSGPPTVAPSGIPLLQAANVGSSQAVGGEIGLRGAASSGLRWNVSYAFASTTNHTRSNQGPVPTAAIDYALSTPRHVIIAGLGYSRDKWELDGSIRWQSSYRDFLNDGGYIGLREVQIRDYITLNARIAYKLTDHITLSLTAQQFNTRPIYQTAGAPIERQVLGVLSVRY
jgi:iron complex outermembrane receptor protein